MADRSHSDFSVYHIYHPHSVAVYAMYWNVCAVLNTSAFAVMSYTVLTRSGAQMGSYRFYLLHQLAWSFVFDLYFALWKPVPLWPFYLGYSAGIFQQLSGDVVMLPLVVALVLTVGMTFSIFLCFFHRFALVVPFSAFSRTYDNLWIRFSVYVVVFLTFVSLLSLPPWLFRPDPRELRHSVESYSPGMWVIFEREPSVFGFDERTSAGMAGPFMVGVAVLLLLLIVSLLAVYWGFWKLMRSHQLNLGSNTVKLQRLLFRAHFIQFILLFVLLTLPITVAIALAVIGVPWVSHVALGALALTSTHCWADFLVLTLHIRPYRTFLLGLLQCTARKLMPQSWRSTALAVIFTSPAPLSSLEDGGPRRQSPVSVKIESYTPSGTY